MAKKPSKMWMLAPPSQRKSKADLSPTIKADLDVKAKKLVAVLKERATRMTVIPWDTRHDSPGEEQA